MAMHYHMCGKQKKDLTRNQDTITKEIFFRKRNIWRRQKYGAAVGILLLSVTIMFLWLNKKIFLNSCKQSQDK